MPDIQLEPGWLSRLAPEFELHYMKQLREFLRQQKQLHKVIYPKGAEIFGALNHTPFEQVKVVILGQDPYHGPGQAHGLCFSVAKGVRLPPSLQNIFKEVQSDLDAEYAFGHGNLTGWADQGVLLLNSVLTVEQQQAASHQGKGWEQFTDRVIELLAKERQHIVFMLWGSYAQKKGQVIDDTRHLVLKAPHPSPLSAHRGFLGCKHFSQCNRYLSETAQSEIDWLAI